MKKEQLKELIRQELQSVLTEARGRNKTDKIIDGGTWTIEKKYVVANANQPDFDPSVLKKIESVLKNLPWKMSTKVMKPAFEKAFPDAKIRPITGLDRLLCLTVSLPGGNADFTVYETTMNTEHLRNGPINFDAQGRFDRKKFRAD